MILIQAVSGLPNFPQRKSSELKSLSFHAWTNRAKLLSTILSATTVQTPKHQSECKCIIFALPLEPHLTS